MLSMDKDVLNTNEHTFTNFWKKWNAILLDFLGGAEIEMCDWKTVVIWYK